MARTNDDDAAEEIDASQAPLIEHLSELRDRLMRALIALVICIVICFIFSDEIYQFLTEPFNRAITDRGREPYQIVTGVQETFLVYLRMSLYAGLFLAFPIIANQLWRFIAPGLYQDEKQAFWPFLAATPILFIMGASLVYYVVAPLALGFFIDFSIADEAKLLAEGGTPIRIEQKVSEYLSLMVTFIFAFGLAFELPVLLTLLGRAGIVSAEGLGAGRKYAVVAIAAAAALLTPPDLFSQIGLGVPVYLLYEISIFLVARVEKKREEKLRADGYYDDDDD